MSKIHVGRRHKVWVLLQRLDKPVEEFDPVPAVWETIYSVRATIDPSSGDETMAGNQVQELITHKVRIRWMPDINSEWRIVVEDANLGNDLDPDNDQRRKLNIKSVLEIQPRKYLELNCVEAPRS